jgi:tetratricopeptide (TPR) repeat protein
MRGRTGNGGFQAGERVGGRRGRAGAPAGGCFQSAGLALESCSMAEPAPYTFLDVPALLERSEPRPRASWLGYAAGAVVLVLLMGLLNVAPTENGRNVARLVSAVVLAGFVSAVGFYFVGTVRRHKAELAMAEAAAELVRLRRWPQAGLALEQVLSNPTRTHTVRAQALVSLATVLARYHRFDDAIAVQDHLIDSDRIDPDTSFRLRAARAMAMLRQDHLVDADRAMSELRRLEGTGESAGLALVEIYRDVKTGHPAEAIDVFQTKLPSLRDQLGHRAADAYALTARAFQQLGRDAEAADAWAKATLLVPALELVRRYPEVEPVAAKYPGMPAPAEALG